MPGELTDHEIAWLNEVLAGCRDGEIELLVKDGRIQGIRTRQYLVHRKREKGVANHTDVR